MTKYSVLICAIYCLSLVFDSWVKCLVFASAVFACIVCVKKKDPLVDKAQICLGVFTILAAPAIFNACDSEKAILGYITLLSAFLLSICLLYNSDFDKLELTFSDIAVIIAGFGIICSIIPSGASLVTTIGRLSPVIRYPNTFGIFMLTAWILSQKDSDKYWVRQIVFIAAIILSFSRGTWVIGIGAALIAFCICRKNIPQRLLCIGAGAIFAVGISQAPIYTEMLGRVQSVSPYASEWQERLFYYHDALLLLKDHPFGMGAGNAYLFQGEYQTGLYYNVPLLHNGLLQFAVDFGVMPALLFLGVFLRYVILLIRRKRFGVRNLACVCLFLHGIIDFDWQYIGVLALIYLFFSENEECKYKVQLPSKLCNQALGWIVTLCACFVVLGSVWASIAYLEINLGKPEVALKMLPDSIVAVKALPKAEKNAEYTQRLENATGRTSYEDESLIYALERCYIAQGNSAKAYEMAKLMVIKRPLFISCYKKCGELGIAYSQELVAADNKKGAIPVLTYLMEMRSEIEYQNSRISSKAERLKHKPELEMDENLMEYETKAYELLESIKTE